MNQSEASTPHEQAERAIACLRAVLEEVLDETGGRNLSLDAERDAAYALEGLDRAEQALRKWDGGDEREVGIECTSNLCDERFAVDFHRSNLADNQKIRVVFGCGKSLSDTIDQ
jgi:hypothetical protein